METPDEEAQTTPAPQKKNTTDLMIGAALLFIAVLSASFIGPTSNMLSTEIALLKTQWSFIMRTVICLPLTFIEIWRGRKGDYFAKLKKSLTLRNTLYALALPALTMIGYTSLIYSAQRMIQSHAYICN